MATNERPPPVEYIPIEGCGNRTSHFFKLYYKSMIVIFWPLICLPLCFTGEDKDKCSYVILVMAVFWVTEALPAHITAFLPIVLFPVFQMISGDRVCMLYMKNAIIIFLGGILLATSMEYSNLHNRIAITTLSFIGPSLVRLNLAMMLIVMFISMWIVNTAACALMMPIAFAILQELQNNGIVKMFDIPGENRGPSSVTIATFLGLAYSASIGGCGTIIGTGTNLAAKGIYETRFVESDELDFLRYTLFAIVPMLIATIFCWFWLMVFYMGFARPGSAAARESRLPPEAADVIDKVVRERKQELGPITYHEMIVIVFFAITILLCSTRVGMPGVFEGWGRFFGKGEVRDASVFMLVAILMFALPRKWDCFSFFKGGDLPATSTPAVMDWPFFNKRMSWGFMFLIGAGFTIADAAISSGWSTWLGKILADIGLEGAAANAIFYSLATTLLTNLTSNVAVANIIMPVIIEICIAIEIHPLLVYIPTFLGCSFCFMLPVGTPPNALVAGAINLRTFDMIMGGFIPTIVVPLVFTLWMLTIGMLIYPEFDGLPDYINSTDVDEAAASSLVELMQHYWV